MSDLVVVAKIVWNVLEFDVLNCHFLGRTWICCAIGNHSKPGVKFSVFGIPDYFNSPSDFPRHFSIREKISRCWLHYTPPTLRCQFRHQSGWGDAVFIANNILVHEEYLWHHRLCYLTSLCRFMSACCCHPLHFKFSVHVPKKINALH